ncbi:MAG: DNA cytosine methyltransferase, partial [Akkermansiaceae bacterium]
PCPVFTDITQFDGQPFRGLVDIISGGFPCTPFSCAGLREADGSDSHLFPFVLKAIEDIQPSLVFLENVQGIVSAKLKGDHWRDPAGTSVLLHVCRELERIGYEATWGIFSAEEVGAPHQRKRIFILARRSEGSLVPTDDCFRASRGEIGERATQELADLHRERLESWLQARPNQERQGQHGYARCGGSSIPRRWPARPTEAQHEWEEPRSLANPNSRKSSAKRGDNEEVPELQGEQGQDLSASLSRGDGEERGASVGNSESGQNHDGESRSLGEEEKGGASGETSTGDAGGRKAEPKLGRAADGIAGGVDTTFAHVERLTMLGNGVVPDTAEKALRELLADFYG